jgi:hypothetical protein
LAESVLKELGALSDSPASQLVKIAGQLPSERIKGVGSILAADRIFGLLERDFALSDIERAVGSMLRPQVDVSLEAHRTLIELARGPDGDARLVTTNFDLLFEAAQPKLPRWTPSDLPDLLRNKRFHGIVHLHGMFDDSYNRPVGGNLVLSSAEFGRAYLAEGWATNFIRSAITRYLIVFVGYSADDPPVQYLLEALSRSLDQPIQRLFAFQEGRESEAEALWKQKGVTAIAYSPADDHAALWETLAEWSKMARSPERWRQGLIRRALVGPEAMQPHERGQVVHLATTLEGARSLAEAKAPIPATWLCAFDPMIRYETPGPAGLFRPDSPRIDPFSCYGLDSDPEPAPAVENETSRRREVPANVIDVFAPQTLDGSIGSKTELRGDRSYEIAPLTRRLILLAAWLVRVSGQPAALWWASGQKRLHPIFLCHVEHELSELNSSLTPLARKGWRYLLEIWHRPDRSDDQKAYAFNQRIAKEGWTPSAHREYAAMLRPALTARRPNAVWPPRHKVPKRLEEMIILEVEYSREDIPIAIPDAELPTVLPLLRRNLEEASALEVETYPFSIIRIPPIEPDPNLPGESGERNSGIGLYVLNFVSFFRRLVDKDRSTAMNELRAWRQDDDPIFARLRIWAAGVPDLLDSKQAGQILTTASDRVFWSDYDQRDLLIALARRWQEFTPTTRRLLERRILRGLPRKLLDTKRYPELSARSIADRLGWLKAQGCVFSFNFDAEIAAMQGVIPDWTLERSSRAADSLEIRGGIVCTDTSFENIANVPIDQLIEMALSAHEHLHGFLTTYDPYAGLCAERPVRVLAALRRGTVSNDNLRIAWTQFLDAGARDADSPAVATLIGRRLSQLPEGMLSTVIRPAVSWLERASKRIFEANAEAARMVFDRLLATLERDPGAGLPSPRSDVERDWFNPSWGSTAGSLTSALLADPALNSVPFGTVLPVDWKCRATRLRALPNDQGRFCLVRLARDLSWFYARDPAWAEAMILSAIDSSGVERDAALAGLLGYGRIWGEELFQRLKPILLALATGEEKAKRRFANILAGLCIGAWRLKNEAGERWLSDEELRRVLVYSSTEMRTHIVWLFGKWPEIDEKLIFLKRVWPLQLEARSSIVAGRLCAIAFDDEQNFPSLVENILPIISMHDAKFFSILPNVEKRRRIFERYPEHALALLSHVLPIEASKWPYGMSAALQDLRKASKSIDKDRRMIELRQRLSRSQGARLP